MTKYNFTEKSDESYKRLCDFYGEENIEEAIKNPVIIHYADKIKPWNNKEQFLSCYWWKYANDSPFEFNKAYEKYRKSLNELSFIEKIFSIKNSKDKQHKVLTVLGWNFYFKRKIRIKS